MIFEFCKNLIAKITFEAGFEIRGNKILVISNDNGKSAIDVYRSLGAKMINLVPVQNYRLMLMMLISYFG